MAQGGLIQWANAIRFNMSNDSGRELFHQQVQTHGFLFLDDYLDNILSGAKQDPLIELVKTPGRRKAIARKPNLASKLGNPISFSLEDVAVENDPPMDLLEPVVAGLQKPHLQAFSKPEKHPSSDPLHILEPRSIFNDIQPRAEESTATKLATVSATYLHIPRGSTVPQHSEEQLSPQLLVDQNNLSIIAEDDETVERSRTSIQLPRSPGHDGEAGSIVDKTSTKPTEHPSQRKESKISLEEATTQDASFHSVPLNSPSEYHSAQATPMSPVFPKNTQVPTESATQEKDECSPKASTLSNPSTLALEGPSSSILEEELIEADIVDMQIPLRDEEPSHKAGVLSIPSLPEPMPLRKSMRAARDPSVGSALLGTATPGTGVGGKRTSWLIKAREVKALDTTAKKLAMAQSTAASLSHPTSTFSSSSKRKSGDVEEFRGATGLEDQERKSKVAKNLESDVAPLKSLECVSTLIEPVNKALPMEPVSEKPSESNFTPSASDASQGVLDRLKKKVEDFGARVGMTKNPGEGSGMATAIAQAKAAAEARIAERNHKEEGISISPGVPDMKAGVFTVSETRTEQKMEVDPVPSMQAQGPQRLSLSDLFPSEGRVKEKHKAPGNPFQFSSAPTKKPESSSSRDSTSTTPPNSPPSLPPQSSSLMQPGVPVFNKPPPVFVPPVSHTSRPLPSPPAKEFTFQQPTQPAFSVQSSLGLGLATSPSFSRYKASAPLTAQSTMESVRSEPLFEDIDDVRAWMPSTQDTEYTSAFDSQSQRDQQMNVCDEDDSWPVDEKLAAGVQWTFGGGISKEDSMTWSTLPSQSQRADTSPLDKEKAASIHEAAHGNGDTQDRRNIPGAFDVEMEGNDMEAEQCIEDDAELEKIVLSTGKSVPITEAKTFRPQSQMSMTSSSSSQSQGGFLNQASKLISSALGTSKKKPEVKKVLQMAAVAAKKQQEEADKKASRLKEMEMRRQLAIQRKAEEEKAKLLEDERKMKEEIERRKREREEMTDKRPLKPMPSKKEEEVQKKKKVEADKKPELKKTTSFTGLNKSYLKPALKQSVAQTPSTTTGSSSQPSLASMKPADASKLPKPTPAPSVKGKGKAAPMSEDEISQPSQFLQGQMAARAKAQIQAAKQTEQTIPSESIELPDINSEYSDSEDEDRPRTFDPPNWAQSPELKQALQLQSTINPDDIFGAVRPLRMEELFRTRTSRFRARTSSANWTGTDRLTVEEEREYARRMGFK